MFALHSLVIYTDRFTGRSSVNESDGIEKREKMSEPKSAAYKRKFHYYLRAGSKVLNNAIISFEAATFMAYPLSA